MRQWIQDYFRSACKIYSLKSNIYPNTRQYRYTLFDSLKCTVMKKNIWLVMAICWFGVFSFSNAQTDKALLTQIAEEERAAVEALVLYPEDVRLAILEASKYPEVLIKMEGIQQRTSEDFAVLLESYSKDVQQDIWDVARYPDLISRLVLEGDRSPGKIRVILQNYPDVIHQRALKVGVDYYNLLEKVDALQYSSDLAFRGLISTYPPETQDALRTLTDLPEVLTILTDNIRLTILVGDMYQKDPDWLWRKADSLNLVVARQRAEDLEEWKQSLEDNPDAVAELKNTATAYEEEYGYDDVYYDYDDDIYYDHEVETVIVERHYYHHYPYWFGYPRWYVYPRWRPYPWWYDWGFYVRPAGTVVVVGFPSYYVTNWYFYHPHHWYHHPHLTSHFVDYYYGHRRSTGSIVAGVDNWIEDHQPVLGNDRLATREGRVDRIRDLGKMEEARANYNRRNPAKAMTQKEYLDKNARRYPNLSKATPPSSKGDKVERTDRAVPRPDVKVDRPDKERPTRVEPSKREQPPKVTVPRKETRPKVDRPTKKEVPKVTPPKKERTTDKVTKPKTRTEKNKTNYGRIDKAKDVHRQRWDKPKTTTRPARPRVTTPPRNRTPRTTPRTSPRTTPKNRTNKNNSQNIQKSRQ